MNDSTRYIGYDIIDGALVMDEGVITKGSLDLEQHGELTTLPAGLSVSGHLDLSFCRSLTQLPDGLRVNGYLALSQCIALTALPADISIAGSLYLEGTSSLATLPNGFSVGSFIYLDEMHISQSDMKIYREFPETIKQACVGKRVIEVIDHHLLRGTKYADLEITAIDPTNGEFLLDSPAAIETKYQRGAIR